MGKKQQPNKQIRFNIRARRTIVDPAERARRLEMLYSIFEKKRNIDQKELEKEK